MMCARYHVDDELSKQIEKVLTRISAENATHAPKVEAKDIHPTNVAPVICANEETNTLGLSAKLQRWGFKGYQGKQVIYNARSETALEKPTFRESVKARRAVIPATWFYEWNPAKEKFIFHRKGEPLLFMAGCCKQYEDGAHFVILTTAANDSVKSVHDRMPLLLESEEIEDWIEDVNKTETFLHKVPNLLECHMEYEQINLFQMNLQ
jgi:putative SOS response-associated peptidase YedK